MNFKGAPFDPQTLPMDDLTDGDHPYVYLDSRIVLAVNVALATERPLLVTGSPGSGKSTLATDIARKLGWSYVETVITSRTRLDDLVAHVDLVHRLSDAQSREGVGEEERYLVPGVFWWAVDPESALAMPSVGGHDPRRWPANSRRGTVLLLDEIDKAEPDLPNDLLGPLNSLNITVPKLGTLPRHSTVLVVITSNRERDMPPAFMRRCVSLELADQDRDFLVAVATSHFGPRRDTLYRDVAQRTLDAQERAILENRRVPSTAEYLDTVRACIAYDERPGSPLWDAIEEAALRKAPVSDETSADV